MKRMPNIELTEAQVYELIKKYKVNSGAEATICESDKSYTLYKIFTEHGKIKPMGDNKEQKVNILFQTEYEYSNRPISTISCNGIIIGYEVSTDCEYDVYKLYQLSRTEIIQFLRETKKALEYFKNNGIIYGDIDPRNILFNRVNGKIMYCDMDNIQIDKYQMDKVPLELVPYKNIHGINEGTHSFMHNAMTLRAFDQDYYCIRNYEIRKLFNRQAKKIILSMRDIPNYKDEFIIEHIKKRII